MSVGENIKRARLKKLMTQRELAEALGMRDAAISKYEKGIVTPPLETLKQLADTLEVPLCSLIMDEDECPQIRKKAPRREQKQKYTTNTIS